MSDVRMTARLDAEYRGAAAVAEMSSGLGGLDKQLGRLDGRKVKIAVLIELKNAEAQIKAFDKQITSLNKRRVVLVLRADVAHALKGLEAVETRAKRLSALRVMLAVRVDVGKGEADLKRLETAAKRLNVLKVVVTVKADAQRADADLKKIEAVARKLNALKTTVLVKADVARASADLKKIETEARRVASLKPTILVAADIARASSDLERIESDARRVGALKVAIAVTADVSKARADLRRIETEARRVGALKVSISVEADVSRASASLDAVSAAARAVGALRPSVRVEADVARALASLETVAAAARSVASLRPSVRVDADVAAALTQLVLVQTAADKLDATRAAIHVESSGAAATLAALQAVDSLAERVDAKWSHSVVINFVTRGVEATLAQLALVNAAATGVAVKAAPMAAALAAATVVLGPLAAAAAIAGAAVLALAAGIALIAAPLVALVVGATQAAEAEKKQESAAKAAESASDAYKSAVEGLADAQRGLADAQRGAAEGVASAQRSYSDSLKGVADSERSLVDARESSAESVASAVDGYKQAVRGIGDAERSLADARKSSAEGVASAVEQYESSVQGIADAERSLADARKSSAEGVASAIEGYKDSLRGIADAERSVSDARASAAESLTSAQRSYKDSLQGIADSERTLADARKASAEGVASAQRSYLSSLRGVADAERTLADSRRAAAESNRAATDQYRQSVQSTQDAERSLQGARQGLSSATGSLATAQLDLNEAMRTEPRRLDSLAISAEEQRLNQRQNTLDLADAQRQLNEARKSGNSADVQRAELQIERLQLSARRNAIETTEAQERLNKARKSGTDELLSARNGVVSASEAEKAAREGVSSAERALLDARKAQSAAYENIAKVQAEGARRIQDSERSLADAREAANRAYAGIAKAQEEGARRISDAERGLSQSREASQRAYAGIAKAQAEGARRISDAERSLSDAREASQKAYAGIAKAQADGSRRVSDAERSLASAREASNKAYAGIAKAQADGARRISDAERGLSDARNTAQKAYAGIANAQQEGARRIQDAERGLASARQQSQRAYEGIAKAQADGARRIADAQRGVQRASEAVAKAARDMAAGQKTAASAGNQVWESLKRQIPALALVGPAFRRAFGPGSPSSAAVKGLANDVIAVGVRALPALGRTSAATATAVGRAFRQLRDRDLGQFEKNSMNRFLQSVPRISASATLALGRFGGGAANLLRIAAPFAERFMRAVAAAGQRFLEWSRTEGARTRVAAFLRSAAPVAEALGRGLLRVGGALVEVGIKHGPTAARVLDLIGKGLAGIIRFVGSVVGGLARLARAIDGATRPGVALRLALIGVSVALGFWLGPVGAVVAGVVSLGLTLKNLYDTNRQFRESVDAVTHALRTGLGVAAGWVAEQFRRYWPGIRETAVSVYNGLKSGAEDLMAVWRRNWPEFQRIALMAWERVKGALREARPAFDWLRQGAAEVVAWFSNNWPLIVRYVDRAMKNVQGALRFGIFLWDTFGKDVGKIVSGLWKIVSGLFETGVRVVGGVLKGMMQLWTGDWRGAAKTAQQIWDDLWRGLERVASGFASIMDGIGDAIWKATTAPFVAAWDYLGRKGAENRKAIAGQWSGIVDDLRSLPGDMYRLGVDMLAGLLKALKEGAGVVKDSVTNLVLNAYDSAKKALGVRSPSTKFAWLADMSVTGYVNRTLAGATRARDAAAKMVGAAVEGARTAARGLQNVAAPGALPAQRAAPQAPVRSESLPVATGRANEPSPTRKLADDTRRDSLRIVTDAKKAGQDARKHLVAGLTEARVRGGKELTTLARDAARSTQGLGRSVADNAKRMSQGLVRETGQMRRSGGRDIAVLVRQGIQDAARMGRGMVKEAADLSRGSTREFGRMRAGGIKETEGLQKGASRSFSSLRVDGSRQTDDLKKTAVGRLTELAKQGTASTDELRKNGIARLSDLRKGGVAQVDDLKKNGVARMTDFQKGATSQAEELKKNGIARLTDLQKGGTTQTDELKKNGVERLTDLQKGGTAQVDDLRKNGIDRITEFQKGGTAQTEELKKNALDRLTILQKEGSTQTDLLKKQGVERLTELQVGGTDQSERLKANGIERLTTLQREGTTQTDELKLNGIKRLTDFQTEGTSQSEQLKNNGIERLTNLQAEGTSQTDQLKQNGIQRLTDFQAQGTTQAETLKANGIQRLTDLQTQGTTQTEDLKTNGISRLTDLQTQGTTQTEDLKRNAIDRMTAMNRDSVGQVDTMKNDGLQRLDEFRATGSKTMTDAGIGMSEPVGIAKTDTINHMNGMLDGMNQFVEETGVDVPFAKPIGGMGYKMTDKGAPIGGTSNARVRGMAEGGVLDGAGVPIAMMASGGLMTESLGKILQDALWQQPEGGMSDGITPRVVYGERGRSGKRAKEAYIREDMPTHTQVPYIVEAARWHGLDVGVGGKKPHAHLPAAAAEKVFQGQREVGLKQMAEGGLFMGVPGGYILYDFQEYIPGYPYSADERHKGVDVWSNQGGSFPVYNTGYNAMVQQNDVDWSVGAGVAHDANAKGGGVRGLVAGHLTNVAPTGPIKPDSKLGDTVQFIEPGNFHVHWQAYNQGVLGTGYTQAEPPLMDPKQALRDVAGNIGTPSQGTPGGGTGPDYRGMLEKELPKTPDLPKHKIGDAAEKMLDDLRTKLIDKVMEKAPQGGTGTGSGPGTNFTGGGDAEANRKLGKEMNEAMGWGSQWSSLDSLWTKESGWDNKADNPTSDAYGIPQGMMGPGGHVPPPGYMPPESDPKVQIDWGLGYIGRQHGDPNAAWAHSQANNWYGAGGIARKPHKAVVGELGPELMMPLHDPRSARQFMEFVEKIDPRGKNEREWDPKEQARLLREQTKLQKETLRETRRTTRAAGSVRPHLPGRFGGGRPPIVPGDARVARTADVTVATDEWGRLDDPEHKSHGTINGVHYADAAGTPGAAEHQDLSVGWNTVNESAGNVIRYRLNSNYAAEIRAGIGAWNALGGAVRITEAGSGPVDLDIYDRHVEDGVMARTYSDGRMAFSPVHMGDATGNAKRGVAAHEFGHSLGMAHVTTPSVLNTPIYSDRTTNHERPTSYDISEYRRIWGGSPATGSAPPTASAPPPRVNTAPRPSPAGFAPVQPPPPGSSPDAQRQYEAYKRREEEYKRNNGGAAPPPGTVPPPDYAAPPPTSTTSSPPPSSAPPPPGAPPPTARPAARPEPRLAGFHVRYGSVPRVVWDRLLAMGWRGDPNDGMEALYPPATFGAANNPTSRPGTARTGRNEINRTGPVVGTTTQRGGGTQTRPDAPPGPRLSATDDPRLRNLPSRIRRAVADDGAVTPSEVSRGQWEQLRRMGWKDDPTDRREALYPPSRPDHRLGHRPDHRSGFLRDIFDNLPFRVFARGGFVTQPSLGLIGEEREEAVVPFGDEAAMDRFHGSMERAARRHGSDERSELRELKDEVKKLRRVQEKAHARNEGGIDRQTEALVAALREFGFDDDTAEKLGHTIGEGMDRRIEKNPGTMEAVYASQEKKNRLLNFGD